MQKRPLHSMFMAIPRHYDLVNHVITLCLDSRWRQKAARECLATRPRRVLDLCCGTGDLAIYIARLAENDVEIFGIDYSEPMLRLAATKASAKSGKNITFVYADVASLPFTDGYFDCVGISFAFRNLTYKNPLAKIYLAEVNRVISPGGRFVIVETSQPKCGLIRVLFHLYLRYYVANVGHWLSGNKSAYRYLGESARRFHTLDKVKDLLFSSGFKELHSRQLLFGVATIYLAIK